VDINNIVRDVDLDVLEKVVSIIAFGDIEAEDTRHLTELNFLKVFRLAQLIIEYLLYVQDCLQSTNGYLQQHRSQQEKYISAARLRVRELEAGFKTAKRELRHARKTVKTFETMAVMGKLGGETQVVKTVVEPSPQPAPPPAPAPAPPPPPPAIDPVQVANAVELVLRKDMGMLSDRLTRAQLETQRMKVERDDMLISLREVESSMREHAASIHNKGGQDAAELKAAREQLTQAHADLKHLRVENEDLASQLGLAQAQRKMVQEEKDTLLQAMASAHRPQDSAPGQQDGSALSAMLLESERRNQKLEQKVGTLEAEVNTLRAQLIRSMKEAAASGEGLPTSSSSRPPGADSDLQRALSAAEEQQQVLKSRTAELEQQLEQQKQQSGTMLEGLQGELSLYQQQAAELRRDLMAAKAAATSSAQQAQAAEAVAHEARAAAAAATAAAAEAEARASHAETRGIDPGPELLALQGRNKELEQAVQQLQAELMAVTQDKQNLEAQSAGLAGRASKLDALARAKDEQLAEAWRLVKELQAQLAQPQANRDSDAVGRVKNQVEEFERIQGMQQQQQPLPQQPEQIPLPPSPFPLDIPQSTGAPQASPVFTRPSPQESRALYQASLSHVAGMGPDRLAVYVEEEARVHSEKPYEYEEDDEARFRHALPHELPGTAYGGVLSASSHTPQELQAALQQHAPALMAQLDDLVASFGMDPSKGRLSDLEYAGAMTELQLRWAEAVKGLQGSDAQGRAEFLRDALLTHLELVKRRTIKKGKEHMVAPDPTDHAVLLAYNARVSGGAAQQQVLSPPRQPVVLPPAPTFAQPPPVPAHEPSPQRPPPTSTAAQPQLPQQQQQMVPMHAQPQLPKQQQQAPTQEQTRLPQQQQQTPMQAQPQAQQGEQVPPTPEPPTSQQQQQQQQQQPQPSPMLQWRSNQEQQLTEMQQQFQQQTQEKAQQRQQQQQQQQQQQGQPSRASSVSPQSTQSGALQRSLSRSRDAPDESLSQMAKSRFAPQPQQQAPAKVTFDTSTKSMTMTSDVDDDDESIGDMNLGLPVSRFTPAHPQPDSPPKPRPILRQPSPESAGPKGSTQPPAAGEGSATAAARGGPSAPPQPLRQAHWLDPPSQPDTPISAKVDTEADQGSVHSWNPNETSSPGTTPRRQGRPRPAAAAAAGGWAWESPEPTPTSEAAAKGATKAGTGDDWNETIKSIGISEFGDDFQASDSKNALGRQPSAGRRAANPAATQQQPQVAASGKPAAARPSAVQRVLDRQNSFDSVSELEV